MSAYCTAAEVQRSCGGADRLRELTDVEESGAQNNAALDDAIADASSWIDSYAVKRHKVPFDLVPQRINRLAVAETVYLLKARNGHVTDEEQVQHEERRMWLEGLAKGQYGVGVDPAPLPATEDQAVEVFELDEDDDGPHSRADYGGFV